MSKNLLVALLFAGILGIVGAIPINGQMNLVGTYFFDTKIDGGRNNFRLLFELKNKNVAVYSNEQNGTETQKRFGNWTSNKKTNEIRIILPPVKKIR